MTNSRGSEAQYPVAHCAFCETKTPHIHERIARDGSQAARAVCLTCRRERTPAIDQP